jgi:hypothetical protein
VAVLIITLALVALDVVDHSVGRWFEHHEFTTSVLAGLLVVLQTILIVDRVVSLRQLRDRSRAIAAQAAILLPQADRASKAVSAMLEGSGDRNTALGEVRTYMMMLLISAPVLIDARPSRTFLEAAQRLAGEFAHAMAVTAKKSHAAEDLSERLERAAQALRAASAPVLQVLDLDQLLEVSSEDVAGEEADSDGAGSEDGGAVPNS